jgi:hypothetical protein
MEILTIVALIVGPIAAVQIQKFLEQRREKHQRRLYVFKVLMATRGTGLSPDHVQALNTIDVEFYGERKYAKVLAAWRQYLDHLIVDQPGDDAQLQAWGARRDDLLIDLMFEMGHSLKYDFDRVQIRRAFYNPKGHIDIEQEQNALRKGLVELLDGKRAIPMDVRSFHELEPTPEQQAANNLLMELVERERQRRLNRAEPDDAPPA